MPIDHEPQAAVTVPLPDEISDVHCARDSAYWGIVVTQFLGAFNDNVFKQLVLLLCTAYVSARDETGDSWQAIASAAFALPFVLFSGIGGYLSDRFSKRKIIVLCKIAEVGVMLAGVAVLLTFAPTSRAGLIGLCGVLFLMGAQSGFFGPAKYGILPEMLRKRDLPNANGFIQMTTFIAIILGIVVAGYGVELNRTELWRVAVICVAIAVVGTMTALFVRPTAVAEPEMRFSGDAFWITRDMRALLRSEPSLLLVLLVSTLFWFVGGALLPGVNAFGEHNLGIGEGRTSVMAAMIGVGIALGCAFAGWISRGRTRFSLVRVGALGVCATLLGLGVVRYFGMPVTAVEWVCRGLLVALGFFGGLYTVPLTVYLQARPPKEHKGRMIGAMNLVNWIGILLSAAYHGIVSKWFGKGNSYTFIILGVLMLIVALAFHGPQDAEGVENPAPA